MLEHTIRLTKRGTVFFKHTKLCLSNLKLKAKVFIVTFFFLRLAHQMEAVGVKHAVG